jgi:hypothetical protein
MKNIFSCCPQLSILNEFSWILFYRLLDIFTRDLSTPFSFTGGRQKGGKIKL